MSLEQSHEIMKLRKMLAAYQDTINEIDDYFEYRMESQTDKKQVRKMLNKLSTRLVVACKKEV